MNRNGRTLSGGSIELTLTSTGAKLGQLSPRLVLVTAESDAGDLDLPDPDNQDGPDRWVVVALGANGFTIVHGVVTVAILAGGESAWIGAVNGAWTLHRMT